MPTLRDMIDGTTIAAAAPQAMKPSPVAQQTLQPKPAAPVVSKAPKGKASPIASHISTHMQDPVGATKEGFEGLTNAKLQYDQQREAMQRNLAPVQSVINHVSQMHNLTPNQDQNMMPGASPDNTSVPGVPGAEGDDDQALDENGNPINMQQTVGKMNQSRPSQVGHQPGVAPGDGQTVRPPKMGMASPGQPTAQNSPQSGGKGQFGPTAAKPKGAGQLPGAKGPGDPKVANRTKNAQTKSSQPKGGVNVTVHAAGTGIIEAASRHYAQSLGLELLRTISAGPESLNDKSTQSGNEVAYNPVMRSGKMKKCDACGEMHAAGKCKMSAGTTMMPKMPSATTKGSSRPSFEAGGPGSGRRPYKFGGEWHSKARGVLKSHGFKNTGGGTEGWRHPSEKGPSRRLDSEYSKQVGNVTHTIRLNHDDGHWSHSTMTASPRGASYDHKTVASDRKGLGNLDSHLSSRIHAAGTSKGAKHRLSTKGQKNLSKKEKAAHWETMDARGKNRMAKLRARRNP